MSDSRWVSNGSVDASASVAAPTDCEPPSPPVSGGGQFEGWRPRQCGEHRPGIRRAWCYQCTEWCYPDDPENGCKGCILGSRYARMLSAAPPALVMSHADAVQLVTDGLFLRQHGERPPGAPVDPEGETWAEWDRRAETFLRSLNPDAQ